MKKNWMKKAVVCGLILMFFGTGATGSIISSNNHYLDSFRYKVLQNFQYKENTITTDQYQLLIIAPTVFSGALQPLITHKNIHNVSTKLMTTEEIYDNYSGEDYKDNAERIKYAIKDALEQWGIKYVLLVGGLKRYFLCNPNNEDNWYVPARYSNLDLDGFPEPKYLSDLYFADIYWNGTKDFCDWNTGGDDDTLFGEWRWTGGMESKDARDLIPDVSVGRWPCRTVTEVSLLVDKTIQYENTDQTTQNWFHTILLAGGDSQDDTTPGNNGVIEGKIGTWKAFNWTLNRYNFTSVKLWPSEINSNITNLTWQQFLTEQNKGSGFTIMMGHGDIGSWFNHQYYANFQDWTIIRSLYLWSLHNDIKTPVAVVSGCLAACFDKDFWTGSTSFTIDCFCWVFTKQKNGGSIAALGNTAICRGVKGVENPNIYEGYLTTRFFEIYGNETDILGDIWKTEIARYVDHFNARNDILHCKSVEIWALLGDPSLKIGGY
jgi:hypothetical protein